LAKTGVKTGPLSQDHKDKISSALKGRKLWKYRKRDKAAPLTIEFSTKPAETPEECSFLWSLMIKESPSEAV
jgi:hypothetical protein